MKKRWLFISKHRILGPNSAQTFVKVRPEPDPVNSSVELHFFL